MTPGASADGPATGGPAAGQSGGVTAAGLREQAP